MEFSICDGSDVSTWPGTRAPVLTAGHRAGVSAWSVAGSLRGLGWTHMHPSGPCSCRFSALDHLAPPKALQPLPWGVSTKEAWAWPCAHMSHGLGAPKPPPALEMPDELMLGV